MNCTIFPLRILAVCFYFCVALVVKAQVPTTSCSSDDIQFSTEITNSVCQSDGKIKVITAGADADNYYNYYFSLESEAEGGFSIFPTTSNLLTSIPPGTYNIVITATCKSDNQQKLRRMIRNVVVGGNYELINASYNQQLSLPSFANCASGTIVMNVTGGLGNYTFKMISAPAGSGITTPVVITPQKNENNYTFPFKKYPAGKYIVEVSDQQCYTATVNLDITALGEVPPLYTEGLYMIRPNLNNTDCNLIHVSNKVKPEFYTSRPAYLTALEDGMFQIGLAKFGQQPNNWQTLKKDDAVYAFNMSPYKISDFYPQSSNNEYTLNLYIRHKECTANTRKYSLYIKPGTVTYNGVSKCEMYEYTVRPWQDYDGNYCFPLHAVFYKGTSDSGPVYHEVDILGYNQSTTPANLEYEKDYYLKVTDANGINIRLYGNSSNILRFNRTISTYYRYLCDGYHVTTDLGNSNCAGVVYAVYDITKGKGVGLEQLICDNIPRNTESCKLQYDRKYEIRFDIPQFPDRHYYSEITVPTPQEEYMIGLGANSINSCLIDHAQPRANRTDYKAIKMGTTFELRGPNGIYQKQQTTSSSSTYVYFDEMYLPEGDYTLTVTDPCNVVKVYNIKHKGFYNYRDFSYTQTEDCSTLRILPKGVITYEGSQHGTDFRITAGPEGGYSHNSSSSGQEILLTKEGVYSLGICAYGKTCPLATATIDFKRPQVKLAHEYTAAYSCVGTSTLGQIYVKGEKGKGPYTYELWNAQNTQKIERPSGVNASDWPTLIPPNDIAFFEYGASGETYTARITDACGNTFSQKLTIGDLTNLTIAGAPNDVVCVGDDIRLTCLPLTNYTWTGPNGFTSNLQNPVIPNAKRNMSGLYKVVVNPPKCGRSYEGYINIQVVPCFAPVNPILMNKAL